MTAALAAFSFREHHQPPDETAVLRARVAALEQAVAERERWLARAWSEVDEARSDVRSLRRELDRLRGEGPGPALRAVQP